MQQPQSDIENNAANKIFLGISNYTPKSTLKIIHVKPNIQCLQITFSFPWERITLTHKEIKQLTDGWRHSIHGQKAKVKMQQKMQQGVNKIEIIVTDYADDLSIVIAYMLTRDTKSIVQTDINEFMAKGGAEINHHLQKIFQLKLEEHRWNFATCTYNTEATSKIRFQRIGNGIYKIFIESYSNNLLNLLQNELRGILGDNFRTTSTDAMTDNPNAKITLLTQFQATNAIIALSIITQLKTESITATDLQSIVYELTEQKLQITQPKSIKDLSRLLAQKVSWAAYSGDHSANTQLAPRLKNYDQNTESNSQDLPYITPKTHITTTNVHTLSFADTEEEQMRSC